MAINRIVRSIFITALIAAVFSFTYLDTKVINDLTDSSSIVFATHSDEVIFDDSIYNEKAEYLQHCLNRLGYTDYDNKVLDTDGHFGNKSESALKKFIEAKNYSYFSSAACEKLMAEAEATAIMHFESGFNGDKNSLIPTAFVYSSVSNINESRDPFFSMSVLKEFPYIITMKPEEMSYKSKRVARFIKKNTKIFGYVNLGPDNPTENMNQWIQADLKKVKTEIDSIANEGWYGVFIDQFGFDWNETRDRQNDIVDYTHSKGLKVMVNSWFIEDVLGVEIDINSNQRGRPSHLNLEDWYLVESFFTDGDSYRGDSSYMDKYLKIKEYKDRKEINVAVLSYKRDSISWQEALEDVNISYILARCLGFDGWWFGKTDNSDRLLYGKDPLINLGKVISGFKPKSNNMYIAETENYILEYYAGNIPSLKLITKK